MKAAKQHLLMLIDSPQFFIVIIIIEWLANTYFVLYSVICI